MTDVERRLTDAFAAVADAVDTTDRAPARAPRRPGPWPAAAAVAVLLPVAGVVTIGVPGVQTDHQQIAPPTTARPPLKVLDPYELYTHCGVREATIDGRYYEAVTPLDWSNPPPDWGNPTQPGMMTVLSDTEAVFTDDQGHTVPFRLRPGATEFLRLCH